MANGINVPIGPAEVEYGDTTYKITKGGIQFQSTSQVHDVTVDQYGETVVKSVYQGGSAQVTVPFALHDLEKLAEAIPNSEYVEDGDKKKITVKAQAGYDMLENAKKLVIKPTSAGTTENDWITIPLAGARSDLDYTYDSSNERIANLTFVAYPDLENDGVLFILGDESAADTP
ncbi:hypothetical protein [Alteribacter populi]|uniref:hypothetical protein n=1 Tax=Alteribacter populi TaxID=2011011 RepID=UPI000BBA9795|nr:hypothetical protein [Alteribacter populi]